MVCCVLLEACVNLYSPCACRWKRDLTDKGLLVANTITYLITRSVSDIALVSCLTVNEFVLIVIYALLAFNVLCGIINLT